MEHVMKQDLEANQSAGHRDIAITFVSLKTLPTEASEGKYRTPQSLSDNNHPK